MANVCRACRHSERQEIDRLMVAGVPLRDIEGRFAISRAALSRHAPHISAELAAAVASERADASEELLDDLAELAQETRRILADPKSPRRVKLQAIARLEKQLLVRRDVVKAQPAPVLNVMESPEWKALCSRLLLALRPHPEASAAVVQALKEAA